MCCWRGNATTDGFDVNVAETQGFTFYETADAILKEFETGFYPVTDQVKINFNHNSYTILGVLDGASGHTITADGILLAQTASGNDTIIRTGDIMPVDNEEPSILDGGAGVDTISYEQVTSFANGLEINLKEGVSTPRGDDYGVPLDVLDNFEHAVGTQYNDIIIGNEAANSLTGGDGINILMGEGGSDTLNGGDNTDGLLGGGAPSGTLDYLFGGSGPDVFEFNNDSMIMDAEEGDFISWAGATKQITGGVQQFWQEGNWAYYTPFSGILAGGGIGLLSDFLFARSVLTDLAVGANFRFGLTTSNQLLIQIGRGRAGVMVLNDYDLDLGDGESTGNLVAYQLDYRTGKAATLAEIKDPILFPCPPTKLSREECLIMPLQEVNGAV